MLLVYVIVGIAIFQTSIANDADPVQTKCYSEHNLHPEVIGPIADDFDTPVDDDEAGNFFFCLWEGHGVMNKDGTINAEKFRDFLKFQEANPLGRNQRDDETVNDIVERCKDTQAKTQKQTSVKLKNCIMKIVHEVN